MDPAKRRAYWRRNLLYLGVLLTVWASVSLGAGVLFVDFLDQYRLGGFKLGFWFAQQGAIYTFIVLIFVYWLLMRRLDRRFGVQDSDLNTSQAAPPQGEREAQE